ncbi:MAG: GNAT family N-acetyltransferase [Actinomycetota bacterium]|jgi:GNAT superfamily N-acetyltransferase|nr:GNAT family N-acetyltransferase [Actinomycetota bacterium]
MSEIVIAKGYVPGSLGAVASLHGTYYHEHWGFGLFFEAKVATELAEFLEQYDDDRDGLWLASTNGQVQGAIVIDGSRAGTDGAHLRWFIVSDTLRGRGVGARLIRTAMEFCRGKGYSKAYLWTFGGLDAARYLYEQEGFVLTQEQQGDQWGTQVNEQRFECEIAPNSNAPSPQ